MDCNECEISEIAARLKANKIKIRQKRKNIFRNCHTTELFIGTLLRKSKKKQKN